MARIAWRDLAEEDRQRIKGAAEQDKRHGFASIPADRSTLGVLWPALAEKMRAGELTAAEAKVQILAHYNGAELPRLERDCIKELERIAHPLQMVKTAPPSEDDRRAIRGILEHGLQARVTDPGGA